MADVFVSYRSSDRPRAEMLASWLTALGVTVWIDRNIVPMEQWRARLDDELQAARIVLVLWGADALSSPEVVREATYAYEHGKLLQVHATGLPLPEPFGGFQAFRMQSWSGEAAHSERHKLIAAVASRLGVDVADELAATPDELASGFNTDLQDALQIAFYYCARQLEDRRRALDGTTLPYREDNPVAVSFSALLKLLRAPVGEQSLDREGTLHRMVEDFLRELEMLAPLSPPAGARFPR